MRSSWGADRDDREKRQKREDGPALRARFRDLADGASWGAPDQPLVVAVSGGVDSMVLLHLVRFGLDGSPGRIEVAHLDHVMREGSAADHDWVRGAARAWGLRFHGSRAEPAPRSEAEARATRYAFLAEVQDTCPGSLVLTGHTADDQAETVLFRIARGSAGRGLAGIRPVLESGVVRPLLTVWREDISAYARQARVPFRADPSNDDLRWSRNRIRRSVLPALEETVPGARRALARLADTSAQRTSALEFMADRLLDELKVDGGEGGARHRAGPRGAPSTPGPGCERGASAGRWPAGIGARRRRDLDCHPVREDSHERQEREPAGRGDARPVPRPPPAASPR